MNSVDLAIEPAVSPFKMLSGVRVVDLTTSIAGPYATMLLSDFGAEVVKVERPGGDDARQWGPPFLHGESLWFLSVNRNKLSVQLDYGSPEGRRVLSDLIDTADVVVTNQLPGVQRKLELDAQSLRAGRPRLIHASLTGFGLSGPNSSLPCYDLIAEGYSGVMDLTGTLDIEPQKVGSPAADMLAGADAAMAVLAALHRRNATGQGCALDISLTESMIRFMSPRIVTYMGSGEVPRRSGGKDSVIAIYQTFETADEPMTLGIGNDAIWKRLWRAFEKPEVAEDARYSDNAKRRAHREEIVAMIQAILSTRPRADWLALFAANKVPAGPIYRVDEVVEDPHFRDRGVFYEIDRDGEALPQVGLGITVDGVSQHAAAPPPRLGQHTEAVMRAILAYDETRIAELRAAGTI
ncbi:CaiB/BaiF CoA transferase family protein [Aquabacter spiritensis]|uniref:Crotonobetainyl-CoA:carnitine CoA-transferase CaiB-like acyl-CoA transferase n=1 Tax=Aquabacter spiritensis TaxID=933073 RepID=A0A4R3M208_9HYPH|nr:CoA transferase [Aquabacter spiritensis]TCT06229.1 crotonobetainyl-CoA:carnitine CoA-transferase CaiB-like acyl-CoA transferase [Aquabacter spiritensis]